MSVLQRSFLDDVFKRFLHPTPPHPTPFVIKFKFFMRNGSQQECLRHLRRLSKNVQDQNKLDKISKSPGHFFHRRNVNLLKLKAALLKQQRQQKCETQLKFYNSILSLTSQRFSRNLAITGDLCLISKGCPYFSKFYCRNDRGVNSDLTQIHGPQQKINVHALNSRNAEGRHFCFFSKHFPRKIPVHKKVAINKI